MTVVYIVLPLGVLLGGLAVAAFLWALSRGQLDDLETPAWRILDEEASDSDDPQIGDRQATSSRSR